MNQFLTKYFNGNVLGGLAAQTAITAIASTVALLSVAAMAGSPVLFGCAGITAIVSAGYVNKWNEAATGSLLWKPRTPLYGL